MSNEKNQITFADLGLSGQVLKAIKDSGYEHPSPIQQQSIPYLLKNKDILGLAQTGTGKTAAFALPLISKIEVEKKAPQILVITPTRELAIQVAESFKSYGRYIKNFQSIAIYGGQDMRQQINALRNGVHVIVGTPGRIIDHLRRKSLSLDNIQAVVLDEADEMLRMGFLDDVELIMNKTPEKKQTALFSATMPTSIKKITCQYLNDPVHVEIKSKTSTVDKIDQKVCMVRQMQKFDVLSRILEVEDFSAMIIFVSTKTATVDIAEKIIKLGFSAAALNGDMNQISREKVVKKLKNSKIDIVIATDVAARGLDVERISHVINFDIPQDSESYVHRIGRTGRAGRSGTAILLASFRESGILQSIERTTGKKIMPMHIPELKNIKEVRMQKFINEIQSTHNDNEKLNLFNEVLDQINQLDNIKTEELIKTLCAMIQKYRPIVVKPDEENISFNKEKERNYNSNKKQSNYKNDDMTKYRVAVGRDDGVNVGDIVGAISNSSDISSKNIGQIKLFKSHTFVWLANSLSHATIKILKKTRVRNRPMDLTVCSSSDYSHKKSYSYKSGSSSYSKNRKSNNKQHSSR